MEINAGVSLATYTTFHIGGPADFFVVIQTVEELQEAYRWAKEKDVPVTILGGGSNVLIADGGVRGLVIKNEIGGITYREEGDIVFVTAGAGILWDTFVAEVVEKGCWGIENLSAIPGTVGATPVQNVGAYGVEVADVITEVVVYDTETNNVLTLSNDACMFNYRDSVFKHTDGKRFFVTHVTCALSRIPKPQLGYKDLEQHFKDTKTPALTDVRNAVIAIRAGKFPDWSVVGTAGSFFKNPIVSTEVLDELRAKYPELPAFIQDDGTAKIPLGWILENILKVKGITHGNVGTYERQALVIVNHGGATAHDVDAFAKQIEAKVFVATGIHIEREVRSLS